MAKEVRTKMAILVDERQHAMISGMSELTGVSLNDLVKDALTLYANSHQDIATKALDYIDAKRSLKNQFTTAQTTFENTNDVNNDDE